MKTVKCIGLLFLLIASVVKAQPPRKFYTSFGGNGYDVGYDVKQTLDGGYIVTGSTSSFGQGNTDLYLFKMDSMGQKKIETSFGGYSNETGKSVVQLADSGFIMTGYTSSTGFGGYDVYLVRADKNGNLLWQKTIGGTDWDFGTSIQHTSDGGFIIAGTTYSYGRGNADGYIIKTDASGSISWYKTYGGKKDDEFKSVIQTADGNYALTGYTKSYADSLGDVWVFKVDVNGDSLDCKFFGGVKEDFANEIIEHSNGDFYVAGATASYGSGKLDGYCLKLNNVLYQIGSQTDGHPNSDESFNGVAIPLSNPSLSAYAETDNLPTFGIHPKIFVLNAGFGYQIATGYGGVKEDEIYKIITTKDSGFACIGYTKSYNSILSDVFFIKMDSTILNSQNVISVKEYQDEFSQLDIFPNPCQNEVYIKTNYKKINKIQLVDMLGNSVYYDDNQANFNTEKIKIDLSHLSNGIYFIKVNSSTNKIIIER